MLVLVLVLVLVLSPLGLEAALAQSSPQALSPVHQGGVAEPMAQVGLAAWL